MPPPAMRLRKLVVHGFKSFADRTEFVFDSPVTGIVGPNGCGKSNVVDAFKWILGEQTAKSLGSDAMLDVLFDGAAARTLKRDECYFCFIKRFCLAFLPAPA